MRRAIVTLLGSAYVLVTIPLAEVGGDILGGGCNEPVDADSRMCQAIYPEGVDAWQVIPIFVVALIALIAAFRSSLSLAHTALATGVVLTLLVPILVFDLLLT